MLKRLSRIPVRLARRVTHVTLRLARLSAVVAAAATVLMVLDRILLPDDDIERS